MISGRHMCQAQRLTSDIGGLDVVLDLLDLLFQIRQRDLGVLDDQVDLEHLDTVTDRDELRGTPNKSVLLDRPDLPLHSGHVGLVVPRLDLQGDDRLGDSELFTRSELLGSLGGFGLVVSGNSLLLDSLGLGIGLVVIGTEEVNVLVVVITTGSGSWGGGGGRRAGGEGGGSGGEAVVLGLVGLDVRVPSGGVRVGAGVRGGWRISSGRK
jgi:hypothetical protein